MADDMTSRDMVDVSSEEAGSKIPQDELNRITDDLITAFKTVFDPEIPVDIYELGLIYKVDIDDDYKVDIDMTLTAPGCPVAGDSPAVNLYFTPDGAGRFDDASLNRQLMTNGVDRSGVVQIESFEVGRIRL